jgi:hypothetical protein
MQKDASPVDVSDTLGLPGSGAMGRKAYSCEKCGDYLVDGKSLDAARLQAMRPALLG